MRWGQNDLNVAGSYFSTAVSAYLFSFTNFSVSLMTAQVLTNFIINKNVYIFLSVLPRLKLFDIL